MHCAPWSDELGSEIAVRFTPPYYPFQILGVSFFVGAYNYPSTQFGVRIYDDNNGDYPGTRLDKGGLSGEATIGNTWVNVPVYDQNIMIEDGDFYVSMCWQTAPGATGCYAQWLGNDKTPPIHSGTSWKWGSGDWYLMEESHPGYGNPMMRVVAPDYFSMYTGASWTCFWYDCLRSQFRDIEGNWIKIYAMNFGEYFGMYYIPAGAPDDPTAMMAGQDIDRTMLVGRCVFSSGVNNHGVWLDEDGKIQKTAWLSEDGGWDDDGDDKIDWWYYRFVLEDAGLDAKHYESEEGPDVPVKDWPDPEDDSEFVPVSQFTTPWPDKEDIPPKSGGSDSNESSTLVAIDPTGAANYAASAASASSGLVGLNSQGLVFMTGNLSSWMNIPGNLQKVFSGDLNGDGQGDIVGINSLGQIYASTDRTNWSQVPGTLSHLAIGDFNGDGSDDMAGINQEGGIYYTVDLSTWHPIPGKIRNIVSGDFDGDGKDDLAGVNTDGRIYYTLNLSTWHPVPGTLYQLAAGDFNGDGKDDLIGLNDSAQIYYTCDLMNWQPVPGLLGAVVCGDFNNDGRDDLAGIGAYGNIYYTTNMATWSQIPGKLVKLISGNFDGTGGDDLAGLNANGDIFYTTNLSTWTQIPGKLAPYLSQGYRVSIGKRRTFREPWPS